VIAADYPELPEPVSPSPSSSTSSLPEPDKRLQLIIYAAGQALETIYLENGNARRLPLYRKENEWSFELRSYERIDQVALGASMAEV
jgi:hypothetical protein